MRASGPFLSLGTTLRSEEACPMYKEVLQLLSDLVAVLPGLGRAVGSLWPAPM